MRRPLLMLFVAISFSLPAMPVFAQSAGSRGGKLALGSEQIQLSRLGVDEAQREITIDGTAEVRVRPTQIRVVLAVTDEAKTAQECQQSVAGTIEKLKAEWQKMGIGADKVVVDFIAVLPRYEWVMEKRGNADVGVERKAGYRIQTNVHLQVEKEATAQAAVSKAFEAGVTDIIAFDYWNRDLDAAKVQARELAVKAARAKADVLLPVLFEARPPIINVQEETQVRYPESLYQSFANAYGEAVTTPARSNVPYIQAYRPRNTYYRGMYFDGDVQGRELPMNPEISVIATVRLYFESPAAKEERKAAAEK